jgi:undecaprenyl-diphosphatase
MTAPDRARGAQWRFISALVALAAIWLAMLLWGRGPLDQAIYRTLYAGHRPALAAIAHVLTALGEPTVLIAAGLLWAVWLWTRGHRHLPFVLIAVTMIGRLLSELQKLSIARARPDLEPHLVVVQTSSFPSGHSASSMIFYLTMALTLNPGGPWHRPLAAAAILLSVLIGLSRVMLGVHWPSDVVGGWAFGLLWVMLTLRLAQRYLLTDVKR